MNTIVINGITFDVKNKPKLDDQQKKDIVNKRSKERYHKDIDSSRAYHRAYYQFRKLKKEGKLPVV